MKKILLKLLLLFVIPALIGFFNFIVDPAHLFDNRSFTEKASTDLVEGYHLANFNNADERLLQKSFIAKLKSPNQVTVLGSSTSMQIGKEYFHGLSFFNSAVSSSTLEDYLAIYNIYEKNNKAPEVIVIGLNPWIFDHHIQNERIGALQEDYHEMLRKLNASNNLEIPDQLDHSVEKVKTLFSGAYFFESVQALQEGTYYRTKDSSVRCPVKFNDGTVNEFKYWKRDTSYVNALARNYANPNETYVKPSDLKCQLLEKFIAYLQSKQKKVIIYISPLHPYTYDLPKVKTLTGKLQPYYNYLSEKYHVLLTGSFNPAAYSLKPEDFYDAQHLKKPGSDKVFSSEAKHIADYLN